MSKEKEVIIQYLKENFNTIEQLRKTNNFSWKPILISINEKYSLTLNPDYERDRDYIRGLFNTLRRLNNWKDTTRIQLKLMATEEFEADIEEIINNKVKEEEKHYNYIDTYNKVIQEPKDEQEEFQQWKQQKESLNKQVGLHVVIGCVHLPAVNQKFFNAFINFLKDVKPELKGLHLIGDILDCKSLSQHDKGQVSDTTLEKEYDESNKYLDILDTIVTKDCGIEKNYIWGNHEERYTRLLKQVDTAKFGKALLSPTKGCKFIERGYTVQEDYQNAKIQLGKYLDLIHGQYITTNATKKHLDVYKKSIMFAHTHKMGAHFDTDKAAFNIGWMGDSTNKAFGYCSRVTKEGWQNGFSVVNIDSEGFYHVQLIQFFNDRFYYGGKEYK